LKGEEEQAAAAEEEWKQQKKHTMIFHRFTACPLFSFNLFSPLFKLQPSLHVSAPF
jgi:hypothetical protein